MGIADGQQQVGAGIMKEKGAVLLPIAGKVERLPSTFTLLRFTARKIADECLKHVGGLMPVRQGGAEARETGN